jgi:serine protease Do
MNCVKYLLLAVLVAGPAYGQDVNEAYEKASKEAAAKVAPCVVKIETSGGHAVVGGARATGPGAGVRKGVGPTTGLIVDKDGYIISSAFNFANKPTDIFVTIPGRPRLVAKIIANDTTRMLTLLKVDAKDLSVPVAVPKKEMQVGQWALALGRTLDPAIQDLPSISVGIISAIGRIWGKAIQTDAKVSPVNYGGPLVALDGRVFGVLVPASPRGDTEIAGLEWYDSGIGFAIPLEDIFAVLPKLKAGKELRRGLLGITAQQANQQYMTAAIVGTVSPDSGAAKAGLKPGDTIIAIDGKPIANFSQLQHALGPKYEGDVIAVKVTRDGKEQQFNGVVLSGAVTAFTRPFLGILPLRDDPEPGVEIRFVYPKSAAETAGLKAGDRIMKIGPGTGAPALTAVTNRAQLTALVARFRTGSDVKLEVKRKAGGKSDTLTLKLGNQPDDLPGKLPLPSSAKRALEQPKRGPAPKAASPKKAKTDAKEKKGEVETGLLQRTNKTLGRQYWVYVPENYDKNISHGVIVWFHAAGKGGKDADDMVKIWRDFCEDYHFLLVGPKAKSNEGWVASETEEVVQDLRTVLGEYTVDRNRVIAHGMGVGGQMAFYIGFHARDLIRGVAVSGAVLGSQP